MLPSVFQRLSLPPEETPGFPGLPGLPRLPWPADLTIMGMTVHPVAQPPPDEALSASEPEHVPGICLSDSILKNNPAFCQQGPLVPMYTGASITSWCSWINAQPPPYLTSSPYTHTQAEVRCGSTYRNRGMCCNSIRTGPVDTRTLPGNAGGTDPANALLEPERQGNARG